MPCTIKAILSLVLSIFISSSLLAQTDYPLTIIDGLGNEVTIKNQPQLISSKTIFSDEILFELIDTTALSSLTNLASDPHYSNIAHKLDDKIQRLDLNVEAILSNSPDILFAANWSEADKVEQLRSAGIPIYLINTPLTLDAIKTEIQVFGQILNANESAEKLINSMDEKLKSLASARQAIAEKKWVALDYNSWGTSSGKNTTWQAVLDGAGLINGAANFEQGSFGQVPLSKELIIAINPDILFLPSWEYGDSDGASAFYKQVINDPALKYIKAIQYDRVYQIPEALRGSYSHYMIDTIKYMIDTVGKDITKL